MNAAAEPLVERLTGLKAQAQRHKQQIRYERERLGQVMSQIRDLEQRLAALGVRLIVQER